MSAKNKSYLTKTITFNGETHTLYSLDGETWSSRKDELTAIMDRHKEEAAYFGSQIRGGAEAKEMREKRRKERISQAEQRREQMQSAKAERQAKQKPVAKPVAAPKKVAKKAAKKQPSVKRKKAKGAKSRKAA